MNRRAFIAKVAAVPLAAVCTTPLVAAGGQVHITLDAAALAAVLADMMLEPIRYFIPCNPEGWVCVYGTSGGPEQCVTK